MRTPIIVGNWKMNLNRAEAVALADALVAAIRAAIGGKNVEVGACPPSVYLDCVGHRLAGSPIGLGAQNMYHQPSGAFTGETSPKMLRDLGCKYVILGHSERRQFFAETDAEVFKKTRAALVHGLVPIVCVGESLAQRQAGKTHDVVAAQFQGSLSGLSAEEIAVCVIAYEPVWAIGTGVVATPQQAQEVHLDLRKLLLSRYNSRVASAVRIQYGGSVNAQNAADLLQKPDVDGALVGGASLKAADFLKIVSVA
ncbi:MAG: triose-phosphate isomerase [Planctomycetia bacterium]|nr:triose-phosphate isomerase [Planctomycetia bacterium]